LIQNGNVKVSDFGTAKNITEHTEESILSSFKGTIPYMSPQVLLQNQYTYQTDIWSLGITLYFMAYGKVPWKTNQLLGILKEIEDDAI